MKTKKIAKIIAIALAFTLITALLFITNAFVGNPVSKYLVDKNSDKYIEKHYKNLDLEKKVSYSFKINGYFVFLESKTIDDLYFTLYYNHAGKLGRDTYENNITNGWNVLTRLNVDYKNETGIIFNQLESHSFFKDTDRFYASAYLMSTIETEDRLVGHEDVLGGIDGKSLELDKVYDISQMGALGGVIDISVRFLDGDESLERGAEAIKAIKTAFDKANMKFYYINFSIFNAEGNYAYRVEFLPYTQIKSENLVDIIKSNRC